MSELNLNSLTHDELKEQAEIMGLSTRGSIDTLRNRIREAIGEADPVAEEAPKQGWVTIQIAEDPTNAQPVYVGHNGKSYYIRRGEPVEVPQAVVNVLKDAITVVFDEHKNARRVPSYPFQILS